MYFRGMEQPHKPTANELLLKAFGYQSLAEMGVETPYDGLIQIFYNEADGNPVDFLKLFAKKVSNQQLDELRKLAH